MTITRLTFCLGLLIVLSGVTAVSQIGGGSSLPPVPGTAPFVGIPKGGAGILETKEAIVIYDQGRGKGKIISRTTTIDDKPMTHEFVIR